MILTDPPIASGGMLVKICSATVPDVDQAEYPKALVLEPVQEPDQLQPERLRKGELPILKFRIAHLEDRDEVVLQGLWRMVLMKGAQRGAVTRPDSQAVPAWAFMMAAIAMLEEKAYDLEGREVIAQAERIDVMTQNAFISMRRFVEWMTPVLLPEAVPVEIRNHQSIDEAEQRRLLEEHPALLDRNGKAQRAAGIAMLIVGYDPAARFLDPR